MSIKLNSLSKQYESSKWILHDVTTTLPSNDITVIVGKNGSGKSTLLNCVGGLLTFEIGSLIVDSDSIKYKIESGNKILVPLEARKKVGHIFQQKDLWNHLSTIDNIIHPLVKVKKNSKDEAKHKAKYYLDLLKIEEKVFELNPSRLSGGQQRKVAIARTLAMEPELLLIDELEANLDQSSLKLVMQILKEQYIDQRKTILIISHSIELLEQFTPNIVVFHEGKIVENAKGAKELLTKDYVDKKKIKLIKDSIDSSTSRWFLANQCLEAAIKISEINLSEKESGKLFTEMGKIISSLIQKFEPESEFLLLIATKIKPKNNQPSEVKIRCAEKTNSFLLNGKEASKLNGLLSDNTSVQEGQAVYNFKSNHSEFIQQDGFILNSKANVKGTNSLIDMMFQSNGSNLTYKYTDRHEAIPGAYNIQIPIPIEKDLEKNSYYEFSKKTKNVYLIGCIVESEVKGIISVDITSENKWSDFIMQQLKLIGNMVAVAIKNHEE